MFQKVNSFNILKGKFYDWVKSRNFILKSDLSINHYVFWGQKLSLITDIHVYSCQVFSITIQGEEAQIFLKCLNTCMYVYFRNSFESILNCRRRARSLANGTDEDSMEIESPQPASASKRGRGRRKWQTVYWSNRLKIFKAALVFNAMNPVVVSGPVCVKKKFTSDNFIHGMKIFRIA